MTTRVCSQCKDRLPHWEYSNNQWNTKGPGASRCRQCVQTGPPPASREPTARENLSHQASFETRAILHPFAQGAFRYVAKGTYTEGKRAGEPCVAKWFKEGLFSDEHVFSKDLDAIEKAIDIVGNWNDRRFVNKVIRVNRASVWTGYDGIWKGTKTLVEPFIYDWEKFNSNTGWYDDSTAWGEVMQALSHFSYHVSGGHFVLCDLQGGVAAHAVCISDPVIHSRTRRFGLTDLGAEGISTFFSTHQCNGYCRDSWTRPKDETPYYEQCEGTTMEMPVPTRHSRPYLYDSY